MYKLVSGMGRLTLNPNAEEFVPAALKFHAAEPSGSNKDTTKKVELNRTDSTNSAASDDETRRYWRDQLPDDIIPDFGINDQSVENRNSWENTYIDENETNYFYDNLVGGNLAFEGAEGEGLDPVEILANKFPGFAAESLADILQANGGDLGLTFEMLTQLELQDDATGQVRQSQVQPQLPNLSAMDFPALASGNEFGDDSRVQRTVGVEDFFTALPYGSGGTLRGNGADFAAVVRKNMSADAAQWQPQRNGRTEHAVYGQDYIGDRLGSFSSGRRHGTPVWLETGEAVSNMYEELREEARDHARVRNAYFEQARQAYLSGNKALAKELSSKGQQHNMLMKEAHNRAGEAIFQQRNRYAALSSPGQPPLLDLHGLHVNEAIPLLKRELASLRLAARSTQQRQQVLICVGTGHHTKGSKTPARLPVAVEKFLAEDERLVFTEQQPGMLRVVVS